jgi:hypothetical protein
VDTSRAREAAALGPADQRRHESRFTAAIGYVRAIGGTALGLLGPFGSTEAIRRGPLTGQLDGRRLALHWNERLRGIPYDINFVLASGTRKIGSGTASLVRSALHPRWARAVRRFVLDRHARRMRRPRTLPAAVRPR